MENNAENNGTFHMQIKLIWVSYANKGANKHDNWWHLLQGINILPKLATYFDIEQLSIIPVVSLLLTFKKCPASRVFFFLIHYFYVSKYN